MLSPEELLPEMTEADLEDKRRTIKAIEDHFTEHPDSSGLNLLRDRSSIAVWKAVANEAADAGWDVELRGPSRMFIRRP